MTRTAFSLVALAALAGCEKPPVPGNAAPSAESAPALSAPSSAAPPNPAASAAAPTPAPAVSDAAAVPVAPPAASPSTTAVGSQLVLLDSEHAKTMVSGCLAAAKGLPERSASPTRALPAAPAVEIVRGAKPRVVHRLQHACCLSGKTRVELRASVVTLVEELSGSPCRCQCESTLDTELALSPGRYELRVLTIRGNEQSEAFRGALDVPAAGSAASPTKLPRSIHVPPSGG